MSSLNADALRCEAVDAAEQLFTTVRRSASFQRDVDEMTLRELLERSIQLLAASRAAAEMEHR